MSFKAWVSLGTVALLVLVIFFARHDIVHAWQLLERVNWLILALLIPLQAFVYFSAGEMIFSYLRAKGLPKRISFLSQIRMALELNFVNHLLPSGGVSGISYMTWRLGKQDVTAARATVAQVIRYIMGFASFVTLLLIALVMITLDGDVNRWTLLLSGLIVFLMVGATVGVAFLASSNKRAVGCGKWITKAGNKVVRTVTFGRKRNVLKESKVVSYFEEMHDEYQHLIHERKLLLKPYLWGIAFNLGDVLLFAVAFWALGIPISPAPIVIAYGLASMVGFALVTPGGAGGYEAVMVAFLATAGVPLGAAIAGVLLARVIILLGTIGLGYIFYQQALLRYGKSRT